MKNYVAKMSYDDEYDIMMIIVATGDMQQVCAMLKDGYSLSMELLELLYRKYGQSAVISALDSSNEDFSQDDDIMLFLKEILESSIYDSVINNNHKKIERINEEREANHFKNLEAKLSLLIDSEGERTREFYSKLCDSGQEELLHLAVEKYGAQTLCDDLFNHKLLSFIVEDNFIILPEEKYARCLLFVGYEYLLKINQPYAAAMCVDFESCFSGNIIEKVFKVAKAGGLRYYLYRGYKYLYDLLADEQMRSKAKEFGSIGYRAIYRYAKDYFTIDDWYEWYEIDPKEALLRAGKCSVSRLWLLKHGHLRTAFYKK